VWVIKQEKNANIASFFYIFFTAMYVGFMGPMKIAQNGGGLNKNYSSCIFCLSPLPLPTLPKRLRGGLAAVRQ
jgi:hypothetical protein